MKIAKLKIKNLFGISEFEADGRSIELLGANGTGKTSVLDSIRLALTNSSDREYIVKNGEKEGEIFVELDNGIEIKRKPRTNMTDYKSVKENGKEVQSPEKFLNSLFSEMQLDPIKFIALDSKEQNRILLELIEYDWDMKKIEEWFGEVPPGVDYSKTILEVLKQIASEDGYYYTQRRKLNAEIKADEHIVEEMVRSIPENFNAAKWRSVDLGELYTKVEQARQENAKIEKADILKSSYEAKIASFKSEKEEEIAQYKQQIFDEKTAQQAKISSLEAELTAAKERLSKIGENESERIAVAEANYETKISKFNEELKAFEGFVGKPKQNVDALLAEANAAKQMQSHLSEYDRMTSFNEKISELRAKSEEFTAKIELARTLPAQILAEAKLPLSNMSTDGDCVLIDSLPVSNLSEGEKLQLCVDVAVKNNKGLQIVLIDGVEKLSIVNREALFDRCKKANVQFIATRTTDDKDLTVIEL